MFKKVYNYQIYTTYTTCEIFIMHRLRILYFLPMYNSNKLNQKNLLFMYFLEMSVYFLKYWQSACFFFLARHSYRISNRPCKEYQLLGNLNILLYPLFSLEKKGILISYRSRSVVRLSVRLCRCASVRMCVRHVSCKCISA